MGETVGVGIQARGPLMFPVDVLRMTLVFRRVETRHHSYSHSLRWFRGCHWLLVCGRKFKSVSYEEKPSFAAGSEPPSLCPLVFVHSHLRFTDVPPSPEDTNSCCSMQCSALPLDNRSGMTQLDFVRCPTAWLHLTRTRRASRPPGHPSMQKLLKKGGLISVFHLLARSENKS